MIYNKPDYSTGVWAENGNIVYPTSEKIEQGHIVEKPYYEIMNYLQNRVDVGMAYVLQNGLPEWDRLTTYPIDAYVKHNGVVFKSSSQNEDSEPSQRSQIWIQAFPTHQDFLDYVEEIRKIKEVDGYLDKYVSKSSPVMSAKAQGTSYLANSGLISTGDEDVGYSFNQHKRDGIFHDGDSPVAMNEGVIVGKFDNGASSNSYVTMQTLIEYINNALRYKIGDLYTTTRIENPSTTLGYGVWELYGQGQTLVGRSEKADDPNWTKIIGSTFGAYTHQLTKPEMPLHRHQALQSGDENNVVAPRAGLSLSSTTIPTTSAANAWKDAIEEEGGDQPHNNVQPSIVVNIWRRVS